MLSPSWRVPNVSRLSCHLVAWWTLVSLVVLTWLLSGGEVEQKWLRNPCILPNTILEENRVMKYSLKISISVPSKSLRLVMLFLKEA